jgi:hypothetical protein
VTRELWYATADAGGGVYDGSSIVVYGSSVVSNAVWSADTGLFGHERGLAWEWIGGWANSFVNQHVAGIAARGPGEEYALLGTYIPARPNRPDYAHWEYQLGRLSYNYIFGTAIETNFGYPCGSHLANDVGFDHNGDWWIPASDGVCFVTNAAVPGAGNVIPPLIGGVPNSVSVDADGRVWVASGSDAGGNGGLLVYEGITSTNAITLTTSEFNYLTAPVGSNIIGAGNWASGLSTVGAVEERVWAGKPNGELITLAQRWQQLDQSDDIGHKVIENVWLARGRAFLATSNSLHVLMPDGKTWDNRPGIHARSALADQRGNLWIGTDTDVRLYTPSGWKFFTSTVGTPPSGPITSLSEDRTGRIWIGGSNGLTLYDRNRFVFTLTTTNSPLPGNSVQALLVDRSDRVWIGTANGLAQLAGSAWTIYTSTIGLPSISIHSLARLGDGSIAVSTANGLSIYSGTTFISESLPIPANDLPLSVDELGRLWAGSAVKTVAGWQDYYLTNSGLRSSTISANAADKADRVWFSHAPDTGVSVRGAYLPPLADTIPLIGGLAPDHGSAGDTLVITGTGFGEDASALSVVIGGRAVQVINAANTSIAVRLDEESQSGSVSVSRNGRRTTFAGGNRPAFCAVPKIKTVSPTGGTYGIEFDVIGSNFDPGATLKIGTGPARVDYDSPTSMKGVIQPGDKTGSAIAANPPCGGLVYSANADPLEFRVIDLTLSRILLNQGMAAYGLMAHRPTLMQYYLSRSLDVRPTDALKIDSIEITLSDPSVANSGRLRVYPNTKVFSTTMGPPSPALLADIDNSLNVANVAAEPASPFLQGTLEIRSVLRNHTQIVAQGTIRADFDPNLLTNVLLVPIMHSGYTDNDLATMKAKVDGELLPLHQRILPQGGVNLFWADEVLTVDDPVNIPNNVDLYTAAHRMDRIRNHWNETHADDLKALIVMGVVHQNAHDNSTKTGQAFMTDVSGLLNDLLLTGLDQLCDLGNAALQVATLGFVGSNDGCHLEIPSFVGWVTGDANSHSQLVGHEMGHTFGLVKPTALNGSWGEHLSHSVNDELGPQGKSCGDSGAMFDWAKTLYSQPGVGDAAVIVDPIGGTQLRPQNDGNANTARAKAIMSYACSRNDNNVFFEPVDVQALRSPFAPLTTLGFSPINTQKMMRPERSDVLDQLPRPRVVTGPRMAITGIITPGNNSGKMLQVEKLDDSAPLSPDFNSGYWLVQLDSANHELSRIGIFPVFASEESLTNTTGFFGATILRAPNLARLELRHDTTALDTFSAGSHPPTLTLSSPMGGSYTGGHVPITWAASDMDGDPVSIAVEYSMTGTNWTPIGSGSGYSGTLNVPVFQLGGSSIARVRAMASDGFNRAVFTSTTFSIAYQAPQPYIDQPLSGTTLLEGQSIVLSGGASDRQDTTVADANLQWSSDRDGALGSGSNLNATLSVGAHVITFEARNNAGLTATTSISVTVLGDYTYSGIADDEKFASGLNPLDEKAVFSDADHDGLPWIMEHHWHTDPNHPDSDDDGYSDAAEIAAGTDPLNSGDNPSTQPADHLIVSPQVLTFTADLSNDTPLPQQQVMVMSRNPTTWTLTSNANWLLANATSGQTPGSVNTLVKAFNLHDGTYTGVLTFTSAAISSVVTVPVTVTLTNAIAYCDVNRDGQTNHADVQFVIQAVGTNNTQPGFNYRTDLNRDGQVDAIDVQLAQACVPGKKMDLPVVLK